jgi:hypothetical protein
VTQGSDCRGSGWRTASNTRTPGRSRVASSSSAASRAASRHLVG